MGKIRGHIPIRTCISCGAKRNRIELIRLCVNSKGVLLKDVSRNMHGRGAYVCDSKPCIDRLFINRRLKQIFRENRDIVISPDIRE